MIVDSSVLVAVALQQDGYREPWERLVDEGVGYVGAPTLLETGIVLRSRIGVGARGMLEVLLHDLEIQTLPFDDRHWRVALEAFGQGFHQGGFSDADHTLNGDIAELHASCPPF